MIKSIMTAGVVAVASLSYCAAAQAQSFDAAPMNAGPPNMSMMMPMGQQPMAAPMSEPMQKPMMSHHMSKKKMMMKKKMMTKSM